MVQKRLSGDGGRVLADMKIPWEVAQASVETVQPSEEDLAKVFQRWSGNYRDQRTRKKGTGTRPESPSDEILRLVDFSPDFSSFTPYHRRGIGRERSVSCPLGPRTILPRRRRVTDFDSIVRDISDHSLYLKFKNTSSTRIDTNNNTTATSNSPSNNSSPPVSLTSSSSSGELKEMCRADDDIWTDISLEGSPDDQTRQVQENWPLGSRAQENWRQNSLDDKNEEVDNISTHGCQYSPDDESQEYWKFTESVYRTLSGSDQAVCNLTTSRPGSSWDLDSACSTMSDLNDPPVWSTETPLTSAKRSENSCGSNSDENDLDKAKLMDELLSDIYPKSGNTSPSSRRRSEYAVEEMRGRERKKLVRFHSESGGFLLDIKVLAESQGEENKRPPFSEQQLKSKCCSELVCILEDLRSDILDMGKRLVGELQSREDHQIKHQESSDLLTAYLQAASEKRSEDTQVKFSVSPGPGDTGFTEWATAMKMVARLPEGVPQHFRKTLWLTLAEKHLSSRGVSWQQTERVLFSESCNPGDEELSVQIVKDLHRTGCSLFCGVSGQHNQAVLKRVLLAFARWNKNVGYCQGLNMLAALILQVMQGSQSSTVKVMIYLIEGVLPESYFGQNLRGLSVDMAVFRDLLRLKLPQLSKHLDFLQQESKESGTSYEPPLMDVFTMQWLLTIFSNCLPQGTVLRVWDLLFLEGNEVLLKTALAIWDFFTERILAVKSADEFYSTMAVNTREMLELGLIESNSLIRAIDTLNIPEVAELREKYVFNITPWTVATVAKKGLRLLYDPYDSDEEHHNNWSEGGEGRKPNDNKVTPFSNHPDREKIALDISVLKKQYLKLRERQRQAHIIFTAACSSENIPGANSSPALNHLLLGKSALLSMKGRRIEGTIPPPLNKGKVEISGETLHWRDAADRQTRPRRKNNRLNKITFQQKAEDSSRSRSVSSSSSSNSGSSSSSTELCDDSSESDDNTSTDLTAKELQRNQTHDLPTKESQKNPTHDLPPRMELVLQQTSSTESALQSVTGNRPIRNSSCRTESPTNPDRNETEQNSDSRIDLTRDIDSSSHLVQSSMNSRSGIDPVENSNIGIDLVENSNIGIDLVENSRIDLVKNSNIGIDLVKNSNIGIDLVENSNVGIDLDRRSNTATDLTQDSQIGIDLERRSSSAVDLTRNFETGTELERHSNTATDLTQDSKTGIDLERSSSSAVDRSRDSKTGIDLERNSGITRIDLEFGSNSGSVKDENYNSGNYIKENYSRDNDFEHNSNAEINLEHNSTTEVDFGHISNPRIDLEHISSSGFNLEENCNTGNEQEEIDRSGIDRSGIDRSGIDLESNSDSRTESLRNSELLKNSQIEAETIDLLNSELDCNSSEVQSDLGLDRDGNRLFDDGLRMDASSTCDDLSDESRGEGLKDGTKRRNSEKALMQILQENSEILKRIQSQSTIKTIAETEREEDEEEAERIDLIRDLKLEVYRNSIRSLDRQMSEPEDIAEIRKKYSMNRQRSLDVPMRKTYLDEQGDKTKSLDLPYNSSTTEIKSPVKQFSPFPVRSPRRKSQVGVQLGLYSPDPES